MYKQDAQYDHIKVFQQLTHNLLGKNEDVKKLVGNCFNAEKELKKRSAANAQDLIILRSMHQCQVMLLLIMNEYILAEAEITRFESVKEEASTHFAKCFTITLYALCFIARAKQSVNAVRSVYTSKAQAYMKQLQVYTKEGNNTDIVHLMSLVDAEMAILKKKKEEVVMKHFKEAIKGCTKAGLFVFAGIASERAGEYVYDNMNDPERMDRYFVRAHQAYMDYGAKVKIEQLKKNYPKVEFKTAQSTEGLGTRFEPFILQGYDLP